MPRGDIQQQGKPDLPCLSYLEPLVPFRLCTVSLVLVTRLSLWCHSALHSLGLRQSGGTNKMGSGGENVDQSAVYRLVGVVDDS